MFLTLSVVLLVMWLLGFFAFHAAGGLIHILLVSSAGFLGRSLLHVA
jgi:uncharacterized protein DUF5670